MECPNELMKKIHEVNLDLLIKFDEICKKLNLKYSLSSGTLLGAVRNGKFIPWDDDVDVMMPREDYEKFIASVEKETFFDGYFLQHYKTEEYTRNNFAKFGNDNTTWIEDKREIYPIRYGIRMDIFPVDRLKGKFSQKIYLMKRSKYRLARALYFHKNVPLFIRIFYFPVLIVAKHMGIQKINCKQDNFERKHNKGNYTGADCFKSVTIMPYKIFEEYTEIELEGRKFKCIKDPDTYLSAVYGKNYLTPPPEGKRNCHLDENTIIDCDRSWREYIKEGKLCKH